MQSISNDAAIAIACILYRNLDCGERAYHNNAHALNVMHRSLTLVYHDLFYNDFEHKVDIDVLSIAAVAHDLLFDPTENATQMINKSVGEYGAVCGHIPQVDHGKVKATIRMASGSMIEACSVDAKILHDADWLQFSFDHKEYRVYAAQIMKEYTRFFSIEQFAKRRIKFLESIDPNKVFYSPEIKCNQRNIEEEIKSLRFYA